MYSQNRNIVWEFEDLKDSSFKKGKVVPEEVSVDQPP